MKWLGDLLGDWFRPFLTGIWTGIKAGWEFCWNKTASIVAVAASSVALFALGDVIPSALASLDGYLANVIVMIPETTIGAYVDKANRVVPLYEVAGMVSVLLALKVAATIVRFVKGWIPTLG